MTNLDPVTPGQMDVYDCIAEAEKDRAMADKKEGADRAPMKASEVVLDRVERTEEEQRRLAARKAVAAAQAKREGLKKAGVDMGTSSPDLAERLEASVNAQRDRAAERFRARRAVAAMKARKNGGDAA